MKQLDWILKSLGKHALPRLSDKLRKWIAEEVCLYMKEMGARQAFGGVSWRVTAARLAHLDSVNTMTHLAEVFQGQMGLPGEIAGYQGCIPCI